MAMIKHYDGEEGQAAESWCRTVDQAMQLFNWNQQATAAAARSKLSERAAMWMLAEMPAGVACPAKYQFWTGQDVNGNPTGLREEIMKRFRGKITLHMASEAVKDLSKKPTETMLQFLDRVKVAVGWLFSDAELFQGNLNRNDPVKTKDTLLGFGEKHFTKP